MNAELKAKWVEALRSGKYKQTQGVLRSSANHFCCLGVLCDIVDPHAWGTLDTVETQVNGKDVSKRARGWGADENRTSLAIETNRRTGLDATYENTLIALNDDGKPFSVIADYIERHL